MNFELLLPSLIKCVHFFHLQIICLFSIVPSYTLFYSGTEKKEKPQGQREKKEETHSNDQNPQIRASPSPQSSLQTLQTHRQTQESKSSAPAKRFSQYQSTELENGCNDTKSPLLTANLEKPRSSFTIECKNQYFLCCKVAHKMHYNIYH